MRRVRVHLSPPDLAEATRGRADEGGPPARDAGRRSRRLTIRKAFLHNSTTEGRTGGSGAAHQESSNYVDVLGQGVDGGVEAAVHLGTGLAEGSTVQLQDRAHLLRHGLRSVGKAGAARRFMRATD